MGPLVARMFSLSIRNNFNVSPQRVAYVWFASLKSVGYLAVSFHLGSLHFVNLRLRASYFSKNLRS